MKKYTLEDVEFIRAKAYVTYDEAIGLLDAYEGDVVRVMAELERSGKLKGAKSAENTPWETIKNIFRKGYEHRMIIRKENKDICNFSILFWIIVTILAPYVVLPALILAIIFGYKITFRNEEGSAKDFSNIAYTAKENIKKAAGTIRDEFNNPQQNAQTQNTAQTQQNPNTNSQYSPPQTPPQQNNNAGQSNNPDIIIE